MYAGRESRAISESLTHSVAMLASVSQDLLTDSRSVGRGLSFPTGSWEGLSAFSSFHKL